MAQRLTAILPKRSVIGRLAGDEFAVIVDELGPGDETATRQLAQKILDRLADPFFVQGHEVFMTASMGIAYYPDDAPNVGHTVGLAATHSSRMAWAPSRACPVAVS